MPYGFLLGVVRLRAHAVDIQPAITGRASGAEHRHILRIVEAHAPQFVIADLCLLHDLVDCHGKHHRCACQIGRLIIFREGQVQIYGIAHIHTDQPLLEAVDKCV